MKFKNKFGAQGEFNFDLQRVDLFKVTLQLPTAIRLTWEEVEFAIEKFPFPDRAIEAIPIKYMQQTNLLIGHDTAASAVEIPVRYAFAQQTAECLEKWFRLTTNQLTGGVALTSYVKCSGELKWMIPDMTKQVADINAYQLPNEDVMAEGAVYALEGCWIKALKFIDADMTTSNYVNMTFTLQCDRWYAKDIGRLQIFPPVGPPTPTPPPFVA
jgi:hypothetical protein